MKSTTTKLESMNYLRTNGNFPANPTIATMTRKARKLEGYIPIYSCDIVRAIDEQDVLFKLCDTKPIIVRPEGHEIVFYRKVNEMDYTPKYCRSARILDPNPNCTILETAIEIVWVESDNIKAKGFITWAKYVKILQTIQRNARKALLSQLQETFNKGEQNDKSEYV
jgi:hypothetical protein